MPEVNEPNPRWKLYLENIETQERQEPMTKNSGLLSKQEAKRAAKVGNKNAVINDSPWRYKIERMK